MDLRALLKTISNSKREDWNFIAADTFHSTFHYEGPENNDELRASWHYSRAIYIPDVSIAMEWGITWRERYEAEWVNKFPDSRASGLYLDVFYNDGLVHRVMFVVVDGAMMPAPNNDRDMKASKGTCDLLKVIDRMGRAPRSAHDTYEMDLKRAGFRVVDEDWPDFMH